MKDFHCRDMGMNCEFIAMGDTVEEVLEVSARHEEQAHHGVVAPDLKEKLKWLVHDQSSSMHRDSIQRNS